MNYIKGLRIFMNKDPFAKIQYDCEHYYNENECRILTCLVCKNKKCTFYKKAQPTRINLGDKSW